MLELLARLGEGRREGLLHQAIHVLHDAQQVRFRSFEILHLIHKKLVPRGQRLVFLERQGVHAPQLLQVLLRLGERAFLLGTHVRARLGGCGLVDLIWVERQHRHQHLRPELSEQLLGFEGQLLEGTPLQILDTQTRLLGRDLPLVGRGRGLRQLGAQPVQGAACVRDLLGDPGAPLTQAVALGGSLSQGALGGLEGHAGCGLHVRGRGQLRLSRGLAPGIAGALLALGGGCLAQGAGAGGGAPRLFFQGTQAQARLVFGLAGLARGAGRGVGTGLSVFEGLGRADGVGAVESGARGHVLLTGPRDLLGGAACHVVGALGLGSGCLRGRLGAGQLLGFLGALCVFLT